MREAEEKARAWLSIELEGLEVLERQVLGIDTPAMRGARAAKRRAINLALAGLDLAGAVDGAVKYRGNLIDPTTPRFLYEGKIRSILMGSEEAL